ncbi:hypothetical protein [Kutzneria sp. CA-103260]|uniref:hypothetical protein n=1 Tax=Kutzneria sp. CA-103260 TaxID=2802641 RepID=UPI001BA6E47D|nr:hypothetical protein [Kutzneria sp. CA-103260]QUQ72146.1 Cell division suppressor protein YneA [Kutzneria sp. CA-103260]
MATQELLIRPGTRRTRVLRTGAGDFRRPPGRPRPVTAPGVAASAACAPERLSGGLQLALVGVLTFVACLGLAAVNGLSSVGSQPVPSGVATVQAQTGETLPELAHRIAPNSPVDDVVDRIVTLNRLADRTLHAGQPLQVPA